MKQSRISNFNVWHRVRHCTVHRSFISTTWGEIHCKVGQWRTQAPAVAVFPLLWDWYELYRTQGFYVTVLRHFEPQDVLDWLHCFRLFYKLILFEIEFTKLKQGGFKKLVMTSEGKLRSVYKLNWSTSQKFYSLHRVYFTQKSPVF